MIKIRSITLKLLPLIVCSFVLIIVGVLLLSKSQLTKIIDKSQHEIFKEKVDVIWEELNRGDIQLKKTGLVEAYKDDFEKAIISNLKNTYYRKSKTNRQPIILDENSTVILHPSYPAGHILKTADKKRIATRMTLAKHGQFYATFSGNNMWFVYKEFKPWNWIIVYAVPLDDKYEDVTNFITLLFFTMISITALVATLLSFAITKLMRPIGKLTQTAVEISKGNLDYPINIQSSDEIGLLATSFDKMRNSIQEQISKLRDFERYLADIINSMPSVIIGIDSHKNITQWNKNAEKLTGITASKAHNTPLSEVYPAVKEIYPMIIESLEQCEIKKITNREQKSESGSVYENITIYPLSIHSAGGVGAVIRIDNVTKEYELDLQIQHSHRMDAIGQLAGGVAHDFNNMLCGISGASELLEMSLKGKDKELKNISLIKNATERAAGLTKKLLAFSRKGKQLSTVVDLHSIINDAITILEGSIDKRISIQVELKADQYLVTGDPSELQSGILNICVNARDAMPEGGEIHISTLISEFDETSCQIDTNLTPGKYIKISIQDTGTGISPELKTRIFEPFFTTKGVGQGTGLGLAAVYGMVKEHHGHIRLYSELGKGTVFHMFIPISEETTPRNTLQGDSVVHGTGTILVVDDEHIIRETASMLLENLGYTVLLAENGKEAVDLYSKKKNDIDLLVLDMVMPVMDGQEAFDKIIDINPNAKIIISSGYSKNANMTSMEEKGLAGVILKPFNQLEISKLIATVLQ